MNSSDKHNLTFRFTVLEVFQTAYSFLWLFWSETLDPPGAAATRGGGSYRRLCFNSKISKRAVHLPPGRWSPRIETAYHYIYFFIYGTLEGLLRLRQIILILNKVSKNTQGINILFYVKINKNKSVLTGLTITMHKFWKAISWYWCSKTSGFYSVAQIIFGTIWCLVNKSSNVFNCL